VSCHGVLQTVPGGTDGGGWCCTHAFVAGVCCAPNGTIGCVQDNDCCDHGLGVICGGNYWDRWCCTEQGVPCTSDGQCCGGWCQLLPDGGQVCGGTTCH
jgi:hypothetical protein